MSDSKQCSDSAQKGPGTKVTGLTPKDSSASIPTKTISNPSGSEQSANRGKQGQ